MVFSSCSIIGPGGVGFIIEVSEVVGFVIAPYRGGPFFGLFVPVDAFVFGGSVQQSSLVAAVLPEGCESEVLLSVVSAGVVDVVD
jgi:hypothetical protein